jgi:hypothetical protein
MSRLEGKELLWVALSHASIRPGLAHVVKCRFLSISPCPRRSLHQVNHLVSMVQLFGVLYDDSSKSSLEKSVSEPSLRQDILAWSATGAYLQPTLRKQQ